MWNYYNLTLIKGDNKENVLPSQLSTSASPNSSKRNVTFNIYEDHASKLFLIPFILYQKLSSLIFVYRVKCRVKIMTKTFQNVFDQTILWNFWFVCVAYWSQYLLGAFKKQVEKYSVSLTPLLLNRHAWVSVPAERSAAIVYISSGCLLLNSDRAESNLMNKAEKFKNLLNSSASIMHFNFFHFE